MTGDDANEPIPDRELLGLARSVLEGEAFAGC